MPDQPVASVLSCCLVEGDEAALRRARRLRRKALLLSIAVEAALVAAMLLAPLVATSERPRLRAYIPLPPFRGTTQDPPTQPRHGASDPNKDQRGPTATTTVFLPPRIPTVIDMSNDSTPSAPDISNRPPGTGPSTNGVPGGNERDSNSEAWRRPRPPEPAPVQSIARIRTSDISPALLVHRVDPAYPALLKMVRVEGIVRLHAIIGTDGTIQELELVSGHPILAQAALEAVRQWRYRPTLLNGQPVEVETHITVVFELRR